MKKLCLFFALLYTIPAHAQTSGWGKPITDYASNLISGVQALITGVGVVVVIGLFGWGFLSKNPGLYKWAFGGIGILVLAQLGPNIIDLLTSIGGGN